MSRRTRHRRPRRSASEPAAPPTDTPINHERLRQIYTNLRARAFSVGFVSLGIEVEARSPEEMVEKTEAALRELTGRLPEN